ncbi:MAG: AMP-binding protein [Candidatus Acidiferrales bacterium]
MNESRAAEILKNLPERTSDVVKPWAESSPDHPALVETSGAWTYRQLAAAVGETRKWLEASGVRPGDRVMMVCENCRAFVAILLAAAELDAWPVLVNARVAAREVDQIRDHCGARLVIYTTSVSPHAAQHAKRHGAAIGEVTNLGAIGVGQLNHEVDPEPIETEVASRVAALIYTSGTTGMPKGVMLSHRNLLFLAAGSAKIRSLAPEDRLYGILPMSHAVGLSVVLLGALLSGTTLYLAPRFDPVAALASFERDRLTVALGVPAMFALLVEYAKSKGLAALRFPALRIISSSGAPLHAALKADVEQLFGMPLYNGYGVTECSPTIAQMIVEAPRSDTSVGPAFPGIEVKLAGPDGNAVAEGEVGELWVRGPTVMKGYYRAPEETAEAISAEGWFNTRDLARSEDGNLFIVGRTKELLVRFGFNVYPAEVEAVLNAHPAVARSAVIGRSGAGVEGGEEVLAFVQLVPETAASEAEILAHATQHLAPYKVPTQIFVVAAMPLTPTGKVMKDELAKMAAASTPAK